MRPVHLLALALVATSLTASCGSDPVDPGPDTGPMTALIDGDSFVAEFATVSRSGGQVFVNAGASGERAIGFQFPDAGPSNHFVGPGNAVSAGVTIGTSSWLAVEAIGRGTITVTVLTGARIEGSFTLTVVGGPDPATLELTNGRFAIDFF